MINLETLFQRLKLIMASDYLTKQFGALESNAKKTKRKLVNSYSYINSLSDQINKNGDFCVVEKSEDRFQRIFVSWNACKTFLTNSRKIIYLDGTFLVGPNRGNALLAVGQDGADQLITLAFGIVESENGLSWDWFINNLKFFFNLSEIELVIVSDIEKGLLNSISKNLPNAYKSNCALHISRNLFSKYKSQELQNLYWRAVYTYNQKECNLILNQIKDKNINFYNSLIDINLNTFMNSYFPSSRYGKVTSNPVESQNSAIKKFISKDICSFIVLMNNYVMKKFDERRNNNYNVDILSNVQLIVKKYFEQGKYLSVQKSNNDIYQVDNEYIVNLNLKSCTCNKFQDIKIPCCHAMAVCHLNNLNYNNFISEYYSGLKYTSAYFNSIKPLSIKNLNQDNLIAPKEKRSRGRPKIRRIKRF